MFNYTNYLSEKIEDKKIQKELSIEIEKLKTEEKTKNDELKVIKEKRVQLEKDLEEKRKRKIHQLALEINDAWAKKFRRF